MTTTSAGGGMSPETGQSPSEARAALEVIAGADVRDALAANQQPTLVSTPRRRHRDHHPIRAGISPTTLRDLRYVENCPAPTHCTGQATPLASSMRSKSSSRVPVAGLTYRTCAHHNRFHRYRRLRHNARPNSATSTGTTSPTTTTALSATSFSGSPAAKSSSWAAHRSPGLRWLHSTGSAPRMARAGFLRSGCWGPTPPGP